jgi:mlo protein
MLLGFISLLLTVAQAPISNICIPKSAANILLPCKAGQDAIEEEAASDRRSLAGAGGGDYCSKFDVRITPAAGKHNLDAITNLTIIDFSWVFCRARWR